MCSADALDLSVLACALIAFFLYPLLTLPPRLVDLNNMQGWGMKGPGTSSLSRNMRGVYYLSGTKQPSRCNRTESRDRTLCLQGHHRSLAFGLDTSFCKPAFDYMAWRYNERLVTCSGPFFLTSAHEKHQGHRIASLLPLMRLSYVFDKTDPEFADRDPKLFEGALKLQAFGVRRQEPSHPLSLAACPARPCVRMR